MKNLFSISKSIKSKLILSFTLVLLLPCILIGTFAYITSKDTVEEEIVNGVIENIDLLNTTIDNNIQAKIHDIGVLSKSITTNNYQGDGSTNLLGTFEQYIELHPEAVSVFVGTETGAFIQAPQLTGSDFDPREREWYSGAMEKKGEVYMYAHPTASTGEMVVTISQITSDGTGVAAINLSLSHIQQLVNQVKIGDKGYAILLDQNGKYISHPTIAADTEVKVKGIDQVYKNKTGLMEFTQGGNKELLQFVTNDLTGWKIGGNIAYSEITNAASPILKNTIIIIIISIIIGAAIVYFIIKSIVKPIRILTDKAYVISHGDLTEHINVTTKDEIGQLGHAFNDMQSSLISLVQKVEFNVQQVAASAEQLMASAEQTSGATEQVADAIQEVASSAEKQMNGIDDSALALSGITEGVNKIVNHSAKVSNLTHETTIQAEVGGKAVTNTVNQMNSIFKSVVESNEIIASLDERSKEINSILDVITSIAEQTNLLSLNAAIEAARAGEHGKGFAVVADEVRKLAEQSQQSVEEIYGIIHGIQEDVEKTVHKMALVTDDVQSGVKISNEAIEKLHHIQQSMKDILPQMDEVSGTAQQMSEAVQGVTSNVNDLDIIAKGNAASSEEVAASTEEQLASMQEISASAKSLATMAEELSEIISHFKY